MGFYPSASPFVAPSPTVFRQARGVVPVRRLNMRVKTTGSA